MTRACPGPDPHPRVPAYRPPAGAVDCHAHVFGDPASYVAERSFTPPVARGAEWLAMLDVLGIDRGVLVQGSVHGTDNSATAAAILASGGRARGVAVIGPEIDDDALDTLHLAGFRGARLSSVVRGGPGFAALEGVAARIARLGWHLVVHVEQSHHLTELAPRLLATGLPLVIDHMARVKAADGVGDPGFRTLLDLLRGGHAWVKLSALHRRSQQGFPWLDMVPMVHEVVAARPDRVLWGTDWPHPNHYTDMPNDGDLLDGFASWITDEPTRRAILVENPTILYGFPPVVRPELPEGTAR
jgi:2-pyrone-4,6-dicarboxylate lactonase